MMSNETIAELIADYEKPVGKHEVRLEYRPIMAFEILWLLRGAELLRRLYEMDEIDSWLVGTTMMDKLHRHFGAPSE